MEVAAYLEPSVLGRKRAFVTREAFDAKTEASIFSAVGNMPGTECTRQIVRQRSGLELLAVSGLLEKAGASALRVVNHSRRQGFLESEPRSEEPPAKKSKKTTYSDATISGSPSSSSSCATTSPISELIARAKESRERQARCRAREKARQDVLETERAAMPSETIHPTVLKSLGIDEYCVGTYSLLRQLGLFLKANDDQKEQQQHQIFQEELEEGEILDDYGIGKKQHCHRQSFQEELEEGEILG